MELVKVFCKNYKGIDDLEMSFKSGTQQVEGQNASGKTTIMDVVYDTLIDKMSDGSSTANIRPKDKYGADANDDPIIRGIVIEIDGQEIEVKKTTIKKMVKDRQTGEKVFKGNDTSYEIDGFPYKKKDFDKWIDEHFSKDTFTYCLNPQSFLNLMGKSTAEARTTLAKISGYDSDKFISKNPQYAQIAVITKGHTTEETKKVINKQLKNIESDLAIHSERLNFLQGKEFEDVDVSQVDKWQRYIEQENTKLTDAAKKQKELDDKAQDALQMKMKQGDLLNQANKDLIERRSQLNGSIEELKVALYKAKNEIDEYITRNKNLSNSIKELEEDIKNYEIKIFDAQKLQMSKDAEICPVCGNKLKKEDIDAQRKDFEAKKQASIDMLKKFQSEARELSKEHIKEQNSNAEHINLLRERIKPMEEQIEILSGQLKDLPEMKKAEDISEYQELEAKINKFESGVTAKSAEIKAAIRDAHFNIQQAERKVSDIEYEQKRVANEKAENEKQIASVKETIKTFKQQYAQALKNLNMIAEFAQASNKDMQNNINRYFKHFQFELFDTTQEGNIVETCRMMVNGIPYGKGLNHGDMILAEVDLVQGFQKMLRTEMPIFVDDAESVDSDRIPKIDGQLILLRRTDFEGLKITYM